MEAFWWFYCLILGYDGLSEEKEFEVCDKLYYNKFFC